MRLTHEITGITKVMLVLLLLVSFIAGALFSYVYTMGYYAPSEFLIPEKPVIAIQNVEFSEQDTRFFIVTVLNPSYSPSDVNITRIEARVTDERVVHVITSTVPSILGGFVLKKGQSQTFRANWNWANYTDIRLPYVDSPVEIRVFIQDGRGEILETRKPLTRLIITEYQFNPSISTDHFNLTVENTESSQTYVNITAISVEGNLVPTDKVIPQLPFTLNPGEIRQFQCFYNWTGLRGQTIRVGVDTKQGYIAHRTLTLESP